MPANPQYLSEQEQAQRLQELVNAYRALEQKHVQAQVLLEETTMWLESCAHPERRSKELQLMTFGEHEKKIEEAIEEARAFLARGPDDAVACRKCGLLFNRNVWECPVCGTTRF